MHRTLNFLVNLGDAEQVRPISVCFLIDLSGSMAGEPLEQVKTALIRGLAAFARRSEGSAEDQASLTTFDSDIRDVCPWLVRAEFEFLTDCLSAVPDVTLRGGGFTRLYDAVWSALDRTRTGARAENERIIVLLSDGGEAGSTERSTDDVFRKLLECQFGFVDETTLSDLRARYTADELSTLFSLEGDAAVFASEDAGDAWSFLSNEDRLRLKEASRLSRRPVRVISVQWGGGQDEFMARLARESGGEFVPCDSINEASRRLVEVLTAVGHDEQSGVRDGLLMRLSGSLPHGDWYRVVSVNSKSGSDEPQVRRRKGIEHHPVYEVSLGMAGGSPPSRAAIRDAFRSYDRFATDIRGLLAEQQASPEFQSSGVSRELLALIAFRASDPLGLSISADLARSLAKANEMRTLFGSPAEVVFVVLADEWEKWPADAWLRFYATLVELAGPELNLGCSIRGVALVSSQNRGAGDARNSGYAALDRQDFEGLVVEVLTTLNRWQAVGMQLSGVLSSSQDALKRFGSVGAVSLFVGDKEATDELARLELRQFLAGIFEHAVGWTDDDQAERDAVEFVSALNSRGLVADLLRTNKQPSADAIDLLCGPDARLLGRFRSETTVRFPDQSPSTSIWRTIVWQYDDFEDFACKLSLDLEEYISVSHALDFFKARLETNTTELTRELVRRLENATDSQMYGDGTSISPAQARLFLARVVQKLATRLEQRADDQEVERLKAEKAPGEIRLPGRGVMSTAHRAEAWSTYRKAALEAARTLPHPVALGAKYGGAGALLAAVGAVALVAGAPVTLPVVALLTAGAAVIGAVAKYRRRVRQLEDLIELYELAHRSVVRREALDLTRARLAQVIEELQARIGERDEMPSPEQLDPLRVEVIPQRVLLQVFNRDVEDGLSDLYHSTIRSTEEGPFHVDVGREEIDLPTGAVAGPISTIRAKMQLTATVDQRRSLLRTKATILVGEFPSVTVRFVPPALSEVRSETLARIRVQEIVREREFRVVAIAPLQEADRKSLVDAYDNREWHEAVATLVTRSSLPQPAADMRVFSLWREVARYRIWLLRLGMLVWQQSGEEKDDDLYALWKRQAAARREFRSKLRQEIARLAAAEIHLRLPLSNLLSEPFDGAPLYVHAGAFSRPPVVLEGLGKVAPTAWEGLLLSTGNAQMLQANKPFGSAFPQNRWDVIDPPRESGGPGLVSDFELAFVQVVPTPAGLVTPLQKAGEMFLALSVEEQKKLLLPEYAELVEAKSKKKSLPMPFVEGS